MDYKFEDYKDGQSFTATVNDVKTQGKVTLEDRQIYLCQNDISGASCKDKKGYKYSWSIGKAEDLKGFGVFDLVLGGNKSTKPLRVLYLVKYDTRSVDPVELFTSRKDMEKWLSEARENSSILWNSIRVFEVKNELVLKTKFTLRAKRV